MEFFIDTAIIEEIKTAYDWGIIDGVTTNPSLIAQSGRSQEEVIKEIASIVEGPISAEVIATKADEMILEAEKLSQIAPHIVIKLPMTEDGMVACKKLTEKGIKTNITLVFSANQALLAAKCGATYVSPFVGRLDDIGQDGMILIEEIRSIFDIFGFETKILSASLRHPQHVKQVALAGSDIATIPFKAMKALFHHPLTDNGLSKFLEDYRKSS